LLTGLIGRYSAGAVAVAAAASGVLLALGMPADALGLMSGAVLSALNFHATGRFIEQARLAAEADRQPPAGRAVMGFLLRYLILGAALLILILGAGLPAVPTVLGVAAVPVTIYLWQIARLLTGGWRP
jgi:hypothetical protein